MLELLKTGLGILGISIGFTVVAGAIIVGVGMALGSCGGDAEDEGPLDPPAV